MKIRSEHKPFFSLEFVAMTDIVMNMFVFFFISFSLLYTFNPQRESKIKVNLPKGVTDVKSRGEKPLVVTVTGKNDIYIGSTKVSSLALVESLKSAAGTAKQHGIVVKADRQASVDYFVKVLDAAKQAGIEKMGVSIELQPRK